MDGARVPTGSGKATNTTRSSAMGQRASREPTVVGRDPLDEIPEEMFAHILTFLEPRYVGGVIGLVCKRWCALSNDEYVWQRFCAQADLPLEEREPSLSFKEFYRQAVDWHWLDGDWDEMWGRMYNLNAFRFTRVGRLRAHNVPLAVKRECVLADPKRDSGTLFYTDTPRIMVEDGQAALVFCVQGGDSHWRFTHMVRPLKSVPQRVENIQSVARMSERVPGSGYLRNAAELWVLRHRDNTWFHGVLVRNMGEPERKLSLATDSEVPPAPWNKLLVPDGRVFREGRPDDGGPE